MNELAHALWLLVIFGGPVVLGAGLAYGWLRWRRRNKERGLPAEGRGQDS